MICLPVDIPKELCIIDEELKAIYHSKNTVCVWNFATRDDRFDFMNAAVGLDKSTRKNYYKKNYSYE